MYIPKPYEMNDPTEITAFIHAHSFGVLMSTVEGRPSATHLPFLYHAEQRFLFAHMAKANPQWRNLDGQAVMAVFSGPHAYISPSWYRQDASVPTWNYVAVHVHGNCSVIDEEEELGTLLENTVRFYEPDSELLSKADESFYRNMMKAIVGFRIDITSVEGTAKLSQNKSTKVQQRVITNLSTSADQSAQAVAQLMQRELYKSSGGDTTHV